jgi:hypothetical protein
MRKTWIKKIYKISVVLVLGFDVARLETDEKRGRPLQRGPRRHRAAGHLSPPSAHRRSPAKSFCFHYFWILCKVKAQKFDYKII